MEQIRAISNNAPQPLDTLFLLFQEGFLPIRVTLTNELSYTYIPANEAANTPIGNRQIQPSTFISWGYLSSNILGVTDILRYSPPTSLNMLLYAEFGISPPDLQMFNEYPARNKLRTFASNVWSENVTQFGYIDGNMSGYNNPSDVSGLLIVPSTDITFDFYNPTQHVQTWQLRIGFVYFTYTLIKDAQYIYDSMNGILPRKPKSYVIGSANNPIPFSSASQNMIKGAKVIPYEAITKSQIESSLGGA